MDELEILSCGFYDTFFCLMIRQMKIYSDVTYDKNKRIRKFVLFAILLFSFILARSASQLSRKS
jgi:uncharacterized membrane protein